MRPLAEVNALSDAAFLAAFASIAEHSPWVAERAGAARPYASCAAMVDAFQAAIAAARREEQMALLRAHPDLAGRLAPREFAEASRREQAGAGLDRLDETERARFLDLNARYRERFGIPFILAVRGTTPERILASFEERLGGALEEEVWTALAQVMRIVRFRLQDSITDMVDG